MHIPVQSCYHLTSYLICHLAEPLLSVSPLTCCPPLAEPTLPRCCSRHHTAAAKTSPSRGEWSTTSFHATSSTINALLQLVVLSLHHQQCQDPVSLQEYINFQTSAIVVCAITCHNRLHCRLSLHHYALGQCVLPQAYLHNAASGHLPLSQVRLISKVPLCITCCDRSVVLNLSIDLNSMTL